jgi:hypothetical protein
MRKPCFCAATRRPLNHVTANRNLARDVGGTTAPPRALNHATAHALARGVDSTSAAPRPPSNTRRKHRGATACAFGCAAKIRGCVRRNATTGRHARHAAEGDHQPAAAPLPHPPPRGCQPAATAAAAAAAAGAPCPQRPPCRPRGHKRPAHFSRPSTRCPHRRRRRYPRCWPVTTRSSRSAARPCTCTTSAAPPCRHEPLRPAAQGRVAKGRASVGGGGHREDPGASRRTTPGLTPPALVPRHLTPMPLERATLPCRMTARPLCHPQLS